jgi:hypothetical protein
MWFLMVSLTHLVLTPIIWCFLWSEGILNILHQYRVSVLSGNVNWEQTKLTVMLTFVKSSDASKNNLCCANEGNVSFHFSCIGHCPVCEVGLQTTIRPAQSSRSWLCFRQLVIGCHYGDIHLIAFILSILVSTIGFEPLTLLILNFYVNYKIIKVQVQLQLLKLKKINQMHWEDTFLKSLQLLSSVSLLWNLCLFMTFRNTLAFFYEWDY